jgi:hypothetical protein
MVPPKLTPQDPSVVVLPVGVGFAELIEDGLPRTGSPEAVSERGAVEAGGGFEVVSPVQPLWHPLPQWPEVVPQYLANTLMSESLGQHLTYPYSEQQPPYPSLGSQVAPPKSFPHRPGGVDSVGTATTLTKVGTSDDVQPDWQPLAGRQ